VAATEPLPFADEVRALEPLPASEEAQLLALAPHEPSVLEAPPDLGATPATHDGPTEVGQEPEHPEHTVAPDLPEPTDPTSNPDIAAARPPIDAAAAEPPADEISSPPEPDIADDIEADPRAEHRAAVAALTKELSSVIGSVLSSKDYAALPKLQPRAEVVAKPKVLRGAPLRPPAPASEPPVSSAIVAKHTQRPVSSRRSWTRIAMAASSAMMIIASGFVAFGLGGAPRASIPPAVRTAPIAVPAPVLPAAPPLAAVIEPEEHALPPAAEPASPPASAPAKPSSHKPYHAKPNSP
jgi:hypothetical protein